MSTRRWTVEEILEFLDFFQKHEILWNNSHKDHVNKGKREEAYLTLLADINKTGKCFSLDDLKNKIKIIRTVYRKEARKVESSAMCGASPHEIYKPKLFWFAKADSFLRQTYTIRSMTATMDCGESGQEELEESQLADAADVDFYEGVGERVQQNGLPPVEQPTIKMEPPKRILSKKRKYQRRTVPVETVIAELNQAGNKCHSREDHCHHEDQFDKFASYMAAQIRQLPARNAIILQLKIQNLVTNELLRVMPTSGETDISPVSCVYSSGPSSNEDSNSNTPGPENCSGYYE